MNNVYREATMKKNVEKVVRLRGIAEANGVAIEAGIATGIDTIGDIGKFVSIRSDGSLACVDLSLGFLFCSIDLYFCLCASTILS